MVVPVEVIWDALWRGYSPLAVESTRSGIAKAALLHEVLQHPQVKSRDPVSQRLALLFIMRCLPVIFAGEAGARRLRAGFMDDTQSTFLLRRLTPAESEERRKSGAPAIPGDFKASLKQELRDEILGRKSAHQLVDISREMQVRKPAKRNATVGDLRPSKRQKRTSGQRLTPSSSSDAGPASTSAPASVSSSSEAADKEISATPLTKDSPTTVVASSSAAEGSERAMSPSTTEGASEESNSDGSNGRAPLSRGSGTVLLRSATAGEAEVRRLAANRSASMLVQPVSSGMQQGSSREVLLLRATVNIMQKAIQNLTARVTQLEAKERNRASKEKEANDEEEEEELELTPPLRSQPLPQVSQRRPERRRQSPGASSASRPLLARPMLVADGE